MSEEELEQLAEKVIDDWKIIEQTSMRDGFRQTLIKLIIDALRKVQK